MNKLETFESFLVSQSVNVPIFDFVVNLFLAALVSHLLSRVYIRYGNALSNRSIFSKNLVIITMTTTVVITIIKSSLALSLGLVGALSIVRFRAAIKEPEELVYLFLVIGIGLGLGANQRIATIVASTFILLLVYLSGKTKSQVATDSLHGLSVVVPNTSGLNLDQITGVLIEADADLSIKRYDETEAGFEVLFYVKIPNLDSLSKTGLFYLN